MKLSVVESWDEARSYLEMLAQTIKDDLCPLLRTKGGAPHTISREVFSYVDYLGALYVGTSGVECNKWDGLARVGIRFKRYLEEVMSKCDEGYKGYSEVIYQMYRNGPIHNFEPRNLRNGNKLLIWAEYQGSRKGGKLPVDKGRAIIVDHLVPCKLPNGRNTYCLPVSANFLIDDLLNSIHIFKNGLGNPDERVNRWNETAKILSKPKECNFNLP